MNIKIGPCPQKPHGFRRIEIKIFSENKNNIHISGFWFCSNEAPIDNDMENLILMFLKQI